MPAETALVSLLLGAILFAQLALSRSVTLLTRQFWLDEIITFTLVSDRSVMHSVRAIIGGLDTNPPTYHLLLRAFTKLVGRVNEASLRWFALLSMVTALTGLYVNLRQVYRPEVVLTTLLALLAHPLVLSQAFEGRMYAPWLAATVWFAFFLTQSGQSPSGPCLQILLSGTALLASGLHTLGPLAVVLIVTAQFVFGPWAPSWITLALASSGLVGFVLWLPCLRRQNNANPGTWISRTSAQSVVRLFSSLLSWKKVPLVLLLGAGVAPLLPAIAQYSGTAAMLDMRVLAGLVGLACMPLALVFLSLTVQPLLVDRYAIPVVASFAPPIAAVISNASELWIGLLCAPLFYAGAHELRCLHTLHRDRDQERSDLVRAIRRRTAAEPVFFESLHDLAVVYRYAPDLAGRSFMLDFEAGELGHVEAVRIADRNQSRLLSRFYSWPHAMAWKAVRRSSRFFLVVPGASRERECSESTLWYPGFVAERIEPRLYEFTVRMPRGDVGGVGSVAAPRR